MLSQEIYDIISNYICVDITDIISEYCNKCLWEYREYVDTYKEHNKRYFASDFTNWYKKTYKDFEEYLLLLNNNGINGMKSFTPDKDNIVDFCWDVNLGILYIIENYSTVDKINRGDIRSSTHITKNIIPVNKEEHDKILEYFLKWNVIKNCS